MQHFLRQESVHLYDAVMHYGHTVIDLINKRDDPYNASLVIQSMRNTTFRSESRDRDTFFVFLSIGLFYTNTVPDCQSGSAWASQGSAWASQGLLGPVRGLLGPVRGLLGPVSGLLGPIRTIHSPDPARKHAQW